MCNMSMFKCNLPETSHDVIWLRQEVQADRQTDGHDSVTSEIREEN